MVFGIDLQIMLMAVFMLSIVVHGQQMNEIARGGIGEENA